MYKVLIAEDELLTRAGIVSELGGTEYADRRAGG